MNLVLRCENFIAENITIVFVDKTKIKQLHLHFLHLPTITDVITFHYNEGKKIEGEIYICLDQAQLQAKSYSQTFTQEVSRLVVHGALHLVGYSDSNKKLRKKMTEKENFYLKKTGLLH